MSEPAETAKSPSKPVKKAKAAGEPVQGQLPLSKKKNGTAASTSDKAAGVRHKAAGGSRTLKTGKAELVSITSKTAPNSMPPSEALRTLSKAEKTGLVKIAKFYSRGASCEHRDLLHESFLRYLDGRRKRPPGLPIQIFLAGAMRSIASEWRAQAATEPLTDVPDACGESSVTAGLEVADCLRVLAADHKAVRVFEGKLNGLSQKEIESLVGLTDAQFEAIWRKIQRRLSELKKR